MLREKETKLVDALEENYDLLEENDALKRGAVLSERKVNQYKEENRILSQALREEREKSRLTINKLVDDAELVISEANDIKSQADEKMSASELAMFNERERTKQALQKERDFTSFRVSASEFGVMLICIIDITN